MRRKDARAKARGRGERGVQEEPYDVREELYELYGTPPPEFVPRRAELAAAARTQGRAADARTLRAARRPTLAAWGANLLLRSDPEESRRFLELGQALREAYGTLDAAGIKELSGQRSRVVSALSRQAAVLARDAGHRLSRDAQQDVAATLHAVLADQDAADRWAAGCLTSALTPPADFPATHAPAAGAPRKPAARNPVRKPVRAPAVQRPPSGRRTDELAERRRLRQERLAEARATAEAAVRDLRDRRAERKAADTSLARAHDRYDRARRQTATAEERLHRLREELRTAEQEQRGAEQEQQEAQRVQEDAESRSRAAADAVSRAEQAVHDTGHEVDRLAPGSDD